MESQHVQHDAARPARLFLRISRISGILCGMKSQVTFKIWPSTQRLLRLVAAITGERMIAVVDRLVRAEYERLKAEGRAP